MKKIFLNEFSAFELKNMIRDGEIDSALTIFGSCESHGWHLPLGPDLFVPTEIARRAALRLSKTVVVPGVPFGTSLHYNHYPLSVTLRFETTVALAEDVFTSLIEHGIRHIVILNGHDGNIPALEIAARKVKDRFRDAVLVFVPAWWEITGARLADMFEAWRGLGHGGEGETSITMAVRPELVDMSRAERQMPEDVIALGEFATVIWDIGEITKTGATGDPTKATPEKGQKMLQCVTDFVVDLVRDLEKRSWEYDNRKRISR